MLSIAGYHYTLLPAVALLALLLAVVYEAARGRLGSAKRLYGYAAIAALVAWAIYTVPYVTHDYSLKPVYESTSPGLPWWLLPATAWSTGGGSLFLFAVIAAVGGYLVARGLRGRDARLYMLVAPLISAIVVVDAWMYGAFDLNPHPEKAGLGLNPLLKSFWLYPHPLATFGGFALLAVAAAAFMLRIRSRSAVIVYSVGWAMLTLGIMLGGLWSYETFGWAGYWAWDPVETSELMVWLAATAIPHVMVALGELTPFTSALTVSTVYLAMFVTRGGLSVLHSFAMPDLAADVLLAVSLLLLAYALYTLVFADYRRLVTQARSWIKTPFNLGMGVATTMLLYAALLVTFTLLVPSVRAALGLPNVSVPQMSEGVRYFNPRLYPAAFALLAGITIAFLGDRLGWRGSAALVGATSILAGFYAWYAYNTRALAPLTPPETNAVMAAGIVFSSVTIAALLSYLGLRAWNALKAKAAPLASRLSRIARDKYLGVALIHLGFALVLLGVFMGGTYSFNNEIIVNGRVVGTYLYRTHLKPGDELTLPGGKVLVFEGYRYGINPKPVDIYSFYVCRILTYYAAQQALLALHFNFQPLFNLYVEGEKLAETPPYSLLLNITGQHFNAGNVTACTGGCRASIVVRDAATNTTVARLNATISLLEIRKAMVAVQLSHRTGFHGNPETVFIPLYSGTLIIRSESLAEVLRSKHVTAPELRIVFEEPARLPLPMLGEVNVTAATVSMVAGYKLGNSTGEVVAPNAVLRVDDAVAEVNGTTLGLGFERPYPFSLLVYLAVRQSPFASFFRDLAHSSVAVVLENPSKLWQIINTKNCPGKVAELAGALGVRICQGYLAAPRYVPENSYLIARFLVVDKKTGAETVVDAKVRFEVNGEVQGIHGSVPKVFHAPIGLTDVYISVSQPFIYADYVLSLPSGQPYQPGFPDLVIYYLHEVFKRVKSPEKRLALAALLAAGLDIDSFKNAMKSGSTREMQDTLARIAYDALSLYLLAERYNVSKPGVATEGVEVDIKLVPGAPLVWGGSVVMSVAAILTAIAVGVAGRREG